MKSSVLSSLVVGAAAGALATIPMTWVMRRIHTELPPTEQDPIPPRQITENALAKMGIREELSSRSRQTLTSLTHYGFGTGAGALFGLFQLLKRTPALTGGICYGLGVWASSYLGWLPAAGLYRRPEHEAPGRHGMMIAAHIVWGAALGLMLSALSRPRRHHVRS